MEKGDLSLRAMFAESPVAFVTLLAAIVALFLSRLGLLPESVKTDAVFALVCLIAIIEVIDRRRQLARIHDVVKDSYDTIQRRIDVHAPIRFDSGASAHKYLADRMRGAREIWHASVGPAYSSKRPAYKEDFENALEALLTGTDVNYRYVTTISSPEKKRRIDAFLANADIQHAFFGTYEDGHGFPPTIYFIVVDKGVLVRCPHEFGEKDEYFWFDEPAVVELLRKYHTLLWHECHKLGGRDESTGVEPSSSPEAVPQVAT